MKIFCNKIMKLIVAQKIGHNLKNSFKVTQKKLIFANNSVGLQQITAKHKKKFCNSMRQIFVEKHVPHVFLNNVHSA